MKCCSLSCCRVEQNPKNRAQDNDKIVTCPAFDYTPHPGGLGCAIFEKMQENPSKLAQVNGITGEEETYKSFLSRCIRTAIAIRSKGVPPDDLIVISSLYSMDVCVPYIATLFLGIKPVTLDSNYSLEDLSYMLKEIKPKLLFAGFEVVEKMEKASKEIPGDVEIVAFGDTSAHTPFSSFLQPHPEESDFKPVPAKSVTDTALIIFTSGSTGVPKGVCLNHYSFIVGSHQIGNVFRFKRVLTFASIDWISTLCIMVTAVLYGDCRIVVPRFDPSMFWKLLDSHKPTLVFLSPILVAILLKFKRPESIKELALKVVALSGGHVAEKHVKDFQKIVPEATILSLFAQTETIGPVTCFNPFSAREMAWLKQKPGVVGTAFPGASLKIVDLETEELLGPNQWGELRVKSRVIMNGYSNIDSSSCWDSEGWLKTGDVAYYDEDRCFYIVDRMKEKLKFRSIDIYPSTVETVILQHPAVEGALVIGMPHKDDGHHLLALVVLSKEVSTNDIEKFVEERVEDAQRLRGGVKIVDRIPMSPTGKIRKTEILEDILQGKIQNSL